MAIGSHIHFPAMQKKTSHNITISWLCGVELVHQSEVRAEMGSQALGFVLYSIVFLMLYLRVNYCFHYKPCFSKVYSSPVFILVCKLHEYTGFKNSLNWAVPFLDVNSKMHFHWFRFVLEVANLQVYSILKCKIGFFFTHFHYSFSEER